MLVVISECLPLAKLSKMKVIPTILQGLVLYCTLLIVWAKMAENVKVTKPKPTTGLPVTIVDDEYRAHFIKQGKLLSKLTVLIRVISLCVVSENNRYV